MNNFSEIYSDGLMNQTAWGLDGLPEVAGVQPANSSALVWSNLVALAPVAAPILVGVVQSLMDAPAAHSVVSDVSAWVKSNARSIFNHAQHALVAVDKAIMPVLPMADAFYLTTAGRREPIPEKHQPISQWPVPVILTYRDFDISGVTGELTDRAASQLRSTIEQWMEGYAEHQCPLLFGEYHHHPISLAVVREIPKLMDEYESQNLTFLREGLPWADCKRWDHGEYGLENQMLFYVASASVCMSLEEFIREGAPPKPIHPMQISAASGAVMDLVDFAQETNTDLAEYVNAQIPLTEQETEALAVIVETMEGIKAKNLGLSFGSQGLLDFIQGLKRHNDCVAVMVKLGRVNLHKNLEGAVELCEAFGPDDECVSSYQSLSESFHVDEFKGFEGAPDKWILGMRNKVWAANTLSFQRNAPDKPVIVHCGAAHVRGYTEEYWRQENIKNIDYKRIG